MHKSYIKIAYVTLDPEGLSAKFKISNAVYQVLTETLGCITMMLIAPSTIIGKVGYMQFI